MIHAISGFNGRSSPVIFSFRKGVTLFQTDWLKS